MEYSHLHVLVLAHHVQLNRLLFNILQRRLLWCLKLRSILQIQRLTLGPLFHSHVERLLLMDRASLACLHLNSVATFLKVAIEVFHSLLEFHVLRLVNGCVPHALADIFLM